MILQYNNLRKILVSGFFLILANTVLSQASFSDKEVIEIATDHFQQCITDPFMGPTLFGLSDMDEAVNAELKYPFQIMSLNSKFVEDEVFESAEVYFKFIEWFVPVFYEDEMRGFVFVGILNDKLEQFGAGSSILAENLNRSIEEYQIKLDNPRYLLILDAIEHIDCWIGMSYCEATEDYIVYPTILNSINLKCGNSPYYNYFSSFEEFFNTVKSGTYSEMLYLKIGNQTLRFELDDDEKSSPATLSLFNLLGKQVYAETMQNAFLLSFPVPVNQLASGIYVYHLKTVHNNYTGRLFVE